MLKIYNHLTKKKELFQPIEKGKVRLYVCGMTVYDFCHIGHARMLMVFDMIVRFLRYRGYDVNYVRNITDIDDKIIQRAMENKESFTSLTERFIHCMYDDLDRLRLIHPDQEPRATHFINEIIQMISILIEKGFAYIGKNGDVFYNIKKFANYGQLSNRNLEQLQAGARVEISEAKNDPLDFVLWKLAKPNEPNWDSPWGKGRPGWHIECSVMALMCLAKNIDIHGGGADLMFPHHENEIAQSEAANGEKFVNTWMHVGYLQIEKEKMAKSLGNVFTIREVLAKVSPEVLRYFLLSSHYRSPLNYSFDNLLQAKQSLFRLYTALRGVEIDRIEIGNIDEKDGFEDRFQEAMDDDFNTPNAIAILFDLAHKLNELKDKGDVNSIRLARLLKCLGGVLGLLKDDPDQFLQGHDLTAKQELNDEVVKIERLIEGRNLARQNKDWQEADRIRDELLQMGVILEDTSKGTIWRLRSVL